jgi:hypothetical protein
MKNSNQSAITLREVIKKLLYTVELRWLELEGTVKMCSSYRKFEPPRSRKFREKNIWFWPGTVSLRFDNGCRVPWTFVVKSKKKENDHWLKFEKWTSKTYIRIIKHYTDINPTVNTRPCISCILNRSRTKWKNVSQERLMIPKRYSENVVFENFLKD